MEVEISLRLKRDIFNAQQALDEYKQRVGENVDSEELARLEDALQDAQNAKDNYLEELLKKYL